jgi:hypothetical protein
MPPLECGIAVSGWVSENRTCESFLGQDERRCESPRPPDQGRLCWTGGGVNGDSARCEFFRSRRQARASVPIPQPARPMAYSHSLIMRSRFATQDNAAQLSRDSQPVSLEQSSRRCDGDRSVQEGLELGVRQSDPVHGDRRDATLLVPGLEGEPAVCPTFGDAHARFRYAPAFVATAWCRLPGAPLRALRDYGPDVPMATRFIREISVGHWDHSHVDATADETSLRGAGPCTRVCFRHEARITAAATNRRCLPMCAAYSISRRGVAS